MTNRKRENDETGKDEASRTTKEARECCRKKVTRERKKED